MDPLFEDTARRAARYLETVVERRVAPDDAAVARLRALAREPLGDAPVDPARVVAELDEIGGPATVATNGGRFFGFVNGAALPAGVAASWLAAAWDQNAFLFAMSPTAAELEAAALRWIVELLGLPAGTGGALVTGATQANLCGLAAARHALLAREGWDVESRGLYGSAELRVVVGAETHPTLRKALGLLGLGRERVLEVPVDAQGRMRPSGLPRLDARTVLCLQAGNVNSGASDPFAELCGRARDAGAWVHVDGAFGLWARCAPERAAQVAGVEGADSWATDAHKWLNTPYDCGVALLRDEESLAAAMSVSAPYLLQDEGRACGRFTPDTSRRARGVEVWAVLRSLGRRGVAELVERTCRYATRFAEGLRAAGLPVLNEVTLNQVVVAVGDEEATRRITAALHAEGTCWCGPTRWRGRPALRISVSSWRTTEADVDASLAAILRATRAATAA